MSIIHNYDITIYNIMKQLKNVLSNYFKIIVYKHFEIVNDFIIEV